MNTTERLLTAGLVALIGASGALGYWVYDLKNDVASTGATLSAREQAAEEAAAEAATLEAELRATIANLESELKITLEARDELAEDLEEEKDKFDNLDDQIRDIEGTVGKLDKLSKIDEELLQKYSKVYFLNEHYVPPKLTPIPDKYLYNEERAQSLHGDAYPFFKDMVDDALDDNIELYVVSAFRSFDQQAGLKGAYTVTYGTGANAFSADQGYSEHQLGTTIDFTTVGINGGLEGFQNTPAYEWLVDNAHKYGFVLSYPENNAYYVYEPWHWRFVGEDLARDLHSDGKFFYDLDQRKIDEYLISIFD